MLAEKTDTPSLLLNVPRWVTHKTGRLLFLWFTFVGLLRLKGKQSERLSPYLFDYPSCAIWNMNA